MNQPLALINRPLTSPGLTSYRYKGRYGWVMIGAKDNDDALSEARRSISTPPKLENLEIWNQTRTQYVPVIVDQELV